MNIKKKFIIKLIVLIAMFLIYQLWTVKMIKEIKDFAQSLNSIPYLFGPGQNN